MKELLKNKAVQIGLAVLIGAAIGALFYPTKRIEERVKQEYQEKLDTQKEEHRQVESQLNEKIDSLEEEKVTLRIETSEKIHKLQFKVRELQAKKTETYYKIVKPDGTVEERRFKESEVNESTRVITEVRREFDQKVSQIEERWKKVHIERVKALKEEFDSKEKTLQEKIAKLESEKITDINPKKYGLEVGYKSDSQYYIHGNIDVFGPVFIGVHTDTNFANEHSVGAGIGLRF